jgi:hypothetical protein
MYTRREFLVGSTTLVTASVFEHYLSYLDNHGEPLLEGPKRPRDILWVSLEADYQIGLNCNPLHPKYPDWNKIEYIKEVNGMSYPKTPSGYREFEEVWGISPENIKDPVPRDWWDFYLDRHGPSAKAHRLLDKLDIGYALKADGEAVGGLRFIEGPMPGNDYMGVHADDEISLSLLQHELNAKGCEIAVELC